MLFDRFNRNITTAHPPIDVVAAISALSFADYPLAYPHNHAAPCAPRTPLRAIPIITTPINIALHLSSMSPCLQCRPLHHNSGAVPRDAQTGCHDALPTISTTFIQTTRVPQIATPPTISIPPPRITFDPPLPTQQPQIYGMGRY